MDLTDSLSEAMGLGSFLDSLKSQLAVDANQNESQVSPTSSSNTPQLTPPSCGKESLGDSDSSPHSSSSGYSSLSGSSVKHRPKTKSLDQVVRNLVTDACPAGVKEEELPEDLPPTLSPEVDHLKIDTSEDVTPSQPTRSSRSNRKFLSLLLHHFMPNFLS